MICNHLGGTGTRDAFAQLAERPQRSTLVAGSDADVLNDMISDFARIRAKLAHICPQPAAHPRDWAQSVSRIREFDADVSATLIPRRTDGRHHAHHRVDWIGRSPSEVALDDCANAQVVQPLTEQEAFVREQVATRLADPISEVSRLVRSHGLPGWSIIYGSGVTEERLSGLTSHDGKSSDALIPIAFPHARSAIIAWAEGNVHKWNGDDTMK